MLNANARAWVDALRSGRFTQGQKALHRADDGRQGYDEFCCLGVACVLAKEAGVDLKAQIHTENADRRVFYGVDFGDPGYLPDEVKDWLGLNSYQGTHIADEEQGVTSLSYANDHGADFNEIADIIESEPDGLFERGD